MKDTTKQLAAALANEGGFDPTKARNIAHKAIRALRRKKILYAIIAGIYVLFFLWIAALAGRVLFRLDSDMAGYTLHIILWATVLKFSPAMLIVLLVAVVLARAGIRDARELWRGRGQDGRVTRQRCQGRRTARSWPAASVTARPKPLRSMT